MGSSQGSPDTSAMPQGESLAYGNPFMPAGGIIGNKATGGGPGVGAPPATTTGGSGSFGMGEAFNQYQNSNDTSMGMGNTTSFGGKDVNINTAFADQKSDSSDWKKALRDGLSGVAQTKLDDLSSMSSFNPNTPVGGGYNESALKQGFKNSDLYNQMMQQQMANLQSQQVKRYNQGV